MTEPWIVHCGHRATHRRHWHDHTPGEAVLCPGMAIPVIPGPDPLLDDDQLDTLIGQLLDTGNRHG